MKKKKISLNAGAVETGLHCVMLFFQGWNLNMFHEGTEENHFEENKWYNIRNVYFNSHQDALIYYAETPCPASQLISGETKEELEKKVEEMKQNYQNEDWLKENLYPYL